MADQRRRLEALAALARDRGATEAERKLAAEHAARLRGVVGTARPGFAGSPIAPGPTSCGNGG